ncbi:hypoxanthine phosphoribosyltransferase domain-containing protein [Naegleria gruberi]|uniref:Hypoxanthine phosphoribosyltransferase n=1 Tax=Naegleria gruberi TaxID=5762 RepID=D2VQ73_NAEGR|nr:hypoxanthine phosphoribosyltransferase domain-containing protein [Naegleria gruberi]EFC41058.1 hypoxanthine phosphoribosyltransferase domain-containing protein [Naegleria gruberi]|eukprot:XP_002673802.1 hypoxanthine phosphoribosyltransferase domain-containing protein [Naegleria gruberi strain NEG-M]
MTLPLPNVCDNILYTEEQLQQRVKELAHQITEHYKSILEEGESLILVPVLKGSYIFAADLSRHIGVPVTTDFIALSSYQDSITSSGEVKIIMDTRKSMCRKHVLIIEDIIDTGYTLSFLSSLFQTRSVKSIKTCVLLTAPKKKRKIENFNADFIGFDIGEKFVVGYGLDFGELYRNLPYIAELKQEIIDQIKNHC